MLFAWQSLYNKHPPGIGQSTHSRADFSVFVYIWEPDYREVKQLLTLCGHEKAQPIRDYICIVNKVLPISRRNFLLGSCIFNNILFEEGCWRCVLKNIKLFTSDLSSAGHLCFSSLPCLLVFPRTLLTYWPQLDPIRHEENNQAINGKKIEIMKLIPLPNAVLP